MKPVDIVTSVALSFWAVVFLGYGIRSLIRYYFAQKKQFLTEISQLPPSDKFKSMHGGN